MREAIQRLGYGNQQIGSNVTTFWLRGPLAISAVEQTRFLSGLAHQRLPFPRSAQQQVAEITQVDGSDRADFFADSGGGSCTGEQQQLHAHQHPDRVRGAEQPLEAGQIDPAHPQARGHLDRQGCQPQWLEGLLEAADRRRALLSQGSGQYPQIQHQMATGPDRGGEGMDDHQQRKDGHGSDRAAASTMGAIERGSP